MTGKEIYNKLSKRDYSGSDEDNYAQLLRVIYMSVSLNNETDTFFNLLEEAYETGRKISLQDEDVEEIFVSNLILV